MSQGNKNKDKRKTPATNNIALVCTGSLYFFEKYQQPIEKVQLVPVPICETVRLLLCEHKHIGRFSDLHQCTFKRKKVQTPMAMAMVTYIFHKFLEAAIQRSSVELAILKKIVKFTRKLPLWSPAFFIVLCSQLPVKPATL